MAAVVVLVGSMWNFSEVFPQKATLSTLIVSDQGSQGNDFICVKSLVLGIKHQRQTFFINLEINRLIW